ncbi:MAG: type II toxin-antitoxin system VapC family toxin [Anaerolinea sp.]|nr:type II toxin-antitoxin system VapC family toxin [Anaerolinea sp.]
MADLLLDTNVLIRHLRQRARSFGFLLQWGQNDNLYISVITRSEILAGMRPDENVITLELLNALDSLPVTEQIADRAGRIIYQLARRGIQLSFPDALIAATALEHQLTVVTTNVAHFKPTGVLIEQLI